MIKIMVLFVLAVCSIGILAACTGTSGAQPAASGTGTAAKPGQTPISAAALPPGDAERGKQIFMSSKASCNTCHPNGNKGVGPSVKGINPDRYATQVRNGFGQMPAYPKDAISDQELADLIAYNATLSR